MSERIYFAPQGPITWEPSSAEEYDEMLNVLPPIAMGRGGFLVGEAMDDCPTSGKLRFSAFVCRGRGEVARFFKASRPMTVAEFRAIELPKLAIHKCGWCGADNEIVNQCRCDPNNLPTALPKR